MAAVKKSFDNITNMCCTSLPGGFQLLNPNAFFQSVALHSLHVCILWRNVQVPVNGTILPIPFLQPRVSLLEMSAIKLRKPVSKPAPCERSRQVLTNPLAALKGLGCTLCRTQCLTLSTLATLLAAGVPHAKNTTPFVRFFATISITFCVNVSQP